MPCKFQRHHHRKIRDIGIGLASYETLNFVYDWIFYPFALAYWGLLLGGIIVVLGSLVMCAVIFWLYDCMRIDWLGAHALRELDAKENKSRFEKLATWIGKPKETWWEKFASPLLFIFLTLPIDPLIVAIHYRKQHFGGITARDWGILVASVISANAWWLLKVGLIVSGLEYIWYNAGGAITKAIMGIF